jgi:hypothetical protein
MRSAKRLFTLQTPESAATLADRTDPPQQSDAFGGHSRVAVALVGLALFLDLAFTRSGSYLFGVGGPVTIYLPDLLLMLGAIIGFTEVRRGLPGNLASTLILIVFVVLQLQRPGAASLQFAVRDLSPFLYLLVVPFVALALRGLSPRSFLRLIRCAALLLAVIVALRSAGLLSTISLPLSGAPLFDARHDVEGVVLGIGVVSFGEWQGLAPPVRLFQVFLVLVAAADYSRAGLLAVVFCVAVAGWRERVLLRTPGYAVAAAFCIAAIATVLFVGINASVQRNSIPTPLAVQRLAASQTTTGTTNARVQAWTLLLRYTSERHALAFGVGPGTDPVAASGAVSYLSGDPTVRAGHSWPVTAVAYFGVVGLMLWLAVVTTILLRSRGAPLRGLAIASVGAYFTAALFGVIVESPFGSLPICVMLAWLLAHRRPRESRVFAAPESYPGQGR